MGTEWREWKIRGREAGSEWRDWKIKRRDWGQGDAGERGTAEW